MNNGYAAAPMGQDRADALVLGFRDEGVSAATDQLNAPVFGLHLCRMNHDQVADLVMNTRRTPGQGMGLVATANIQHIAIMRKDPEFAAAMQQAELVTCDGFPVFRYANHRGCDIHVRTTGREIVEAIMCERTITPDHRLYFVVDSDETCVALQRWAARLGLSEQISVEVPPLGFIHDGTYCQALVERICSYGTSILMLCVGAPQSEIFSHRYRRALPPCWALCVGQSAKIVLGLAPTPPRLVEALSIEWLWRIALEPKRLIGRYASCSLGFLIAVMEDSIARRDQMV